MFTREAEKKIIDISRHYPVIMVTGPRQSGKTTLCRKVFAKKPYVLLENIDVQEFAQKDPRGFLAQFSDGAVLDEVQKVPQLLNYIQGIVDDDKRNGLYILSGSQNILLSRKVSQSLAGRIAILNLLPLSISEIYRNIQGMSWETLAIKGFFPKIYNENIEPHEAISFYFRTYIERDVRNILSVTDTSKFKNFIKLCAGRAGQILNVASLGNDAGISSQTAHNWLSILEMSFLVYRICPYFQNFNKRIIKAPKLYFYDTGMLTYLLEIKNVSHLKNHPLRGSIFENFIVNELVKTKFNMAQDHGLYFYRDSNANEVDIVACDGNNFRALEIKSAATVVSDFFKGLDYFEKVIGLGKVKKYLACAVKDSQKRTNYTILSYLRPSDFWT